MVKATDSISIYPKIRLASPMKGRVQSIDLVLFENRTYIGK